MSARQRLWRIVRWPIAVIAGLVVAIQFVPYGWWHDNPPVVQDAPWPTAESARIARQSCYSCHSNQTDWPAYSYIAPMSWLVRSDVEAGRDEFNFSDWSEAADDVDDAIDAIDDGDMPPRRYTLIHRNATLTDQEADLLVTALLQMGRTSVDDDGERNGDEDSGHGGD